MLILGHRGAIHGEGIAPYQNSLRAFAEALAFGDGFESDACASEDGEIFLIHEAFYADPAKGVVYNLADHLDAAGAACLGRRRLDQLTAAEARKLRLKDGQPIPTLGEAIKLAGARQDKFLNIELKAQAVVEPVLRLVKTCLREKRIAPAQLLLSSFNHFALPMVRQEAPDLKIGAIFVGEDQPTTPLFPWHPGDPAAYTSLTPESLQAPVLKQVRPDFFVMPQEMLTEKTAAMIGTAYPQAQLAAWVFTEKGPFDLPGLLARLKKLPRDKILAMIVDDPEIFKNALEGRSREIHPPRGEG